MERACRIVGRTVIQNPYEAPTIAEGNPGRIRAILLNAVGAYSAIPLFISFFYLIAIPFTKQWILAGLGVAFFAVVGATSCGLYWLAATRNSRVSAFVLSSLYVVFGIGVTISESTRYLKSGLQSPAELWVLIGCAVILGLNVFSAVVLTYFIVWNSTKSPKQKDNLIESRDS